MKNIVMKVLPLMLVIAGVVSTAACPSDSESGEGEGEGEGE